MGAVSEMSRTGFLIDRGKLNSLKERWTREREELEVKARGFYDLPQAFNLDSDDDIRWFLFGKPPGKFTKLPKLAEYDDATKTGKKKLRSGTKAHRELMGIAEIKKLGQPYVLKAWTGRKTETGLVAVDRQGLLAYQIQLQNRLKEVQDYKHPKFIKELSDIRRLLEWLRLYRDYSGISKLISTYVDYPVGSDGRVHSSYLIHGTSTGRLASRDPNLQNIPKKRPEARGPFVAADGSVLVSADYSNLEVRVLAYETGDKALIRAIESGTNIHDENTRTLFNLKPSSPQWEIARRAAKIFMFGGISYGGGDMEIHSKISMEVPELALTVADYKKARENWMESHKGYREWADKIRVEVHKTHQARVFSGRVRTLHGSGTSIEKEALNTPIQGGAASIINRAVVRIHNERNKANLKSRLISQVHDQLIYEVPLSEQTQMTKLIKTEMERPVDYRGQLVSFPVDISIGTSWGDLKGVSDDGNGETNGV
jgi:DNA polymerase I-like protein with 3'-5' exonuclease and polymerase domains